MEEMLLESAAELVAEFLRLLAMDPHTRGIRRIAIIRLFPSVLNLKFSGLQIDSMIADPPDFGEGWLWVDGLLRWS